MILICYYLYMPPVIHVIHVYVGIRYGGQHDSNRLGLSAGPQRSIITYTYNIVSIVLLYTLLI